MQVAQSLVMIGFKAFDGLTYIMPIIAQHDMGDHGRIGIPLKTKTVTGQYAEFIWASKKTGNCIYKEITEKEYNTHFKDNK